MTPRTTTRYGWLPDLPDHRDLPMSAAHAELSPRPARLDLRPHMPPIDDQGALGACTAHAVAAAVAYEVTRRRLPPLRPSRLFIYYNERVLEGTVAQDSGAQIRDGIKVVAQQGVCSEALWPYDPATFTRQPDPRCYTSARLDRVLAYRQVAQQASQMESCLALGFPIVVGISVYSSFESDAVAKTGHVPLPGKTETLVGGHAVLVVGYDAEAEHWICRNSWGARWGMGGYFQLPYAYLVTAGLARDFWAIEIVGAR